MGKLYPNQIRATNSELVASVEALAKRVRASLTCIEAIADGVDSLEQRVRAVEDLGPLEHLVRRLDLLDNRADSLDSTHAALNSRLVQLNNRLLAHEENHPGRAE